MNRDKQLEAIRAACIKANPQIVVNKHAQLIKLDHTVEYFEECRPVRLADVLLAIHAVEPANKTNVTIESDGQFIQRLPTGNGTETVPHAMLHWNLRQDDLTEQSDECITFLISVVQDDCTTLA